MRFSARKCLPFCVIGYIMYNASYIAPAYCFQNNDTESFYCNKSFVFTTAMIGSFLTGFGGAILWVAQGIYIRECAVENNTEYFQGLFWAVFMLQAILGNTIAYFVLAHKDFFGLFFVILTTISLVGLVVFFLLKQPENFDSSQPEQDEDNAKPMWDAIVSKAKDTFFMFGNKQFIPILFYELYRGIVLTYYSGVLVVLTIKQDQHLSNEKVEKARMGASIMIFFGIAEVSGAAITGRLIKMMGKRFGIYLVGVLGLTANIAMLSLVYNKVHFGWPYYIEAALWGFADSSLNTSIIGLLVYFLI